MTSEHLEPVKKDDIKELSKYDEDIHVIDYDEGNFHCAEVFSHEGAFRGCAKTKEEAVKKAVNLYEKEHKETQN